jgi:hypothetical protein
VGIPEYYRLKIEKPTMRDFFSLALAAFICWFLFSLAGRPVSKSAQIQWQGNKDSNLGMLESKSSALTSLAIPLRNLLLAVVLHI